MRNPWTALRRLWHEAKYEEVSMAEALTHTLSTWQLRARNGELPGSASIAVPAKGTVTLVLEGADGIRTTVEGEVHIP